MSDFFASGFSILALGAYIYIARRAAHVGNAPGLSLWFKLCMGAFFVSVAMPATASIALVLAVSVVHGLPTLVTSESALATAHSWTVAASHFMAIALASLILHRSMSWYFRHVAGSACQGGAQGAARSPDGTA